jgi:predicted nuclease of predicted toxin-antitoxin system
MRLLLDECVPARLRRSLPSHQVSTVVQEGWSGVKNGKLLALAATGFDALVTVDKNIAYQQNTSSMPVAVLVLDTASNDLPHLLTFVPSLEAALANLKPGSYVLLKADF